MTHKYNTACRTMLEPHALCAHAMLYLWAMAIASFGCCHLG